MFKILKNLKNKIKAVLGHHKMEMNLYYFLADDDKDELYDNTPLQIFINGKNIYADNPRKALVDDSISLYFYKYDADTIFAIKLLIFISLLDQTGEGVEFTVNDDKWLIIQSRHLFKDLFKAG